MTKAEEAEKAAKGKLIYTVTLSSDKVTFPLNRSAVSDDAKKLIDEARAHDMMVFYTLVGGTPTPEGMVDPGLAPRTGEWVVRGGADKFIGSDEQWQTATDVLETAALKFGVDLVPDPGGAAFYGPKISVQARDAIGRTEAQVIGMSPIERTSLDREEELFTINMGPHHPATHGVLRLLVSLEGEVVRDLLVHGRRLLVQAGHLVAVEAERDARRAPWPPTYDSLSPVVTDLLCRGAPSRVSISSRAIWRDASSTKPYARARAANGGLPSPRSTLPPISMPSLKPSSYAEETCHRASSWKPRSSGSNNRLCFESCGSPLRCGLSQ